MAKKFSLIGFVKTKYKSVKYTGQTLNIGNYIKFYYGSDPKRYKPIVGKVSNILDKGVEVTTDYGYMHPLWERIERIYVPKTTGRLKENRLPATTSESPLPIIDAAIDRILLKVKECIPQIEISDKKINGTTRYRRLVIIDKSIKIEISDKNAIEATVQNCGKIKKIKVNKNKTITSTTIKKIVDGIISEKEHLV